jgi:hypothetical protein
MNIKATITTPKGKIAEGLGKPGLPRVVANVRDWKPAKPVTIRKRSN